jgi:hypothetical protein
MNSQKKEATMKAKAIVAVILVMVFVGCATAPKPTADVSAPVKKVEEPSKLEAAWEWFKENFPGDAATAAADAALGF